MKQRKGTNLYEYLERKGVLETGDEKLIQEARREYYRLYQKRYKRFRRSTQPEYSIYINPNEAETIGEASRKHGLSISRFIKEAALSYTKQVYLVPDPIRIGRIEQMLSHILNEIRLIAETDKDWRSNETNYPKIQKIIIELESEFSKTIRLPPRIDEFIIDQLERNPHLNGVILKAITEYDNQKPNKKE